jgi:hypothetical protein
VAVQQFLAEDRLDPELLKDRVVGHDPLHTGRTIPGRRRTGRGGKTPGPGAKPKPGKQPALNALLADADNDVQFYAARALEALPQ